MKFTFISDTHCKHKQLPKLDGGDILIHCGDISSRGYEHEIYNFLKWFNNIENYKTKIFIAGNHDWFFQDNPNKSKLILSEYPNISYLQDSFIIVDNLKIYGSPWQPEFCNWAFNVQRGDKIKEYWDKIPTDTDVLITHGPPFGILDRVIGKNISLGCEELLKKVKEIKPKVHAFGHIHSGYGIFYDGNTQFINASNLSESYFVTYNPVNYEL
jgi:Icc-related predicted phosphoesterase